MKKFKLTSSANGKVFRSGLYSTAILAAAIVLAVLVNLLAGAIPSKYTEFDLSAAKMYTLGDSSRQLMQSLDQDVTVYYLCETGSEDAIVSKLLDHYADESSRFHWEQKDPALYPAFASQYGAENVSTGSLIVVSGENSVVLDATELYEYDYSDYYTTGSANVTFAGEKQISSAIYKLTSGAESHAFYTTNHGEQAPTSSLTEALEAQNIDLAPLDLLTGTIPGGLRAADHQCARFGFCIRRPCGRDRAAAGLSGKRRQSAADDQCLCRYAESGRRNGAFGPCPQSRASCGRRCQAMHCTATRIRCFRITPPTMTKAPFWTV